MHSSASLMHNIVVLIVSIAITTIMIINSVFYSNLYNRGGDADTSASAYLTMMILNIVGSVAVGLVALWTIFNIATEDNHGHGNIVGDMLGDQLKGTSLI